MNIIQPLLNAVSPQAVQSIAGTLNETPEHTRQGIADALPMVFAGLIGKGSTTTGAAGLLAMMRDRNVDSTMVDRFASGGAGAYAPTSLMREGGSLAETLLGSQFGGTAEAIAHHAGLARGSAQALLGLAAPLALGGIARAAPRSGFTPESLMRFLQGQRDDVTAMSPLAVPSGLLGSRPTVTTRAPVRTGNRFMPWIAGLLAALVVAFLVNQCVSNRVEAPAVKTAPVAVPVTPPAPTGSRLDLPGGITLNVPVGSIGDRLAAFLRGGEPVPRTFTFENLNFDTGEVRLTPESIATLDAIAAILKAYPNAAVRLEGHTDSTGVREANMKLSLDRANSISRALSQRGVAPERITAVGYGPDQPIGSNDTEEGRAQNRRLELTVTSK